MKIGRFDDEGGAGGVVDEAFGGGAEEEFLESGAAAGSEDDEVGVHFLQSFSDAVMDTESAFDDGGKILKVVFRADVVSQLFEAAFAIFLEAGLLDHWKGGAEPANFRIGVDGRAIDVDEPEFGSVIAHAPILRRVTRSGTQRSR